MTVNLELSEWNFIIETLQISKTASPTIVKTAVNLLRPQLEIQYNQMINDSSINNQIKDEITN